MKLNFDWHPYRYFQYERALAQRELKALFGHEALQYSGGLSIETSENWNELASRTTYFRQVVADNTDYVIPLQALLEASSNGGAKETLPGIHIAPSLRTQSTRYSAHGLHEYRGKFNPQIVRAIGNLINLEPGNWILDPFAGSGTTLLEGFHMGWNVVGIDINPLSIEIANAKIAAMNISPSELINQSRNIEQRLSKRIAKFTFDIAFTDIERQEIAGNSWWNHLPNLDYLRSWFTESVLSQVALILTEIEQIADANIRLIFRVILSSILREVSLQNPADLRIRRRKSPAENMPAIPLFIETLNAQCSSILKARRVLNDRPSTQKALLGDIRKASELIRNIDPKTPHFDAAITSPPYVSALPYIDTQRLSLAVLGLINSSEIRTTERLLIGSRELTNRERQQIEHNIMENHDDLPDECIDVCKQLLAAVDGKQDGFRRQNMPALTYQYLRDMSSAFGQINLVLRKGAAFILVVGPNKTRLGGADFIINTPQLLKSLGMKTGFTIEESIELDTYQRYDVHQSNSIRSEVMLILRT